VKKFNEPVRCCGRLSANISHLSQEPSDHDPRAHVASLHVYTGSLVCTRSVPHKYSKENIPHASLPPAFPVERLSSWPPKHDEQS